MPKRGQTGAKQNDGRAKRRPQSPFARRKRKTAPPTGAGWSGKKNAADAVAPPLGNQSESGLFRIAQKPTRNAGREPNPNSRGAGRGDPNGIFIFATRRRRGQPAGLVFPSGSRALEQTPPATRRETGARRVANASSNRAARQHQLGNKQGENGGSSASRAKRRAPRKSTGEATRKQRPAPKPFPNQRRQPADLPANRRRNFPSFKIQTLSANAASANREKSSIGFGRDR